MGELDVLPLLGQGVDRREHVVAERRVAAEDLGVVRRRLIGPPRAPRDVGHPGDERGRVFDLAASDRALELLVEGRPGAARLVDLGERLEGHAVARVLVEGAAEGRGGRVGVTEVAPLDRADRVEELATSGGVARLLERGAVEGEALFGASFFPEEGVDSREELGVRRLVGERGAEDPERAGDIAARHQRLAGAPRDPGHVGRIDRAIPEHLLQRRSGARRVRARSGVGVEAMQPLTDALLALARGARPRVGRQVVERDGQPARG